MKATLKQKELLHQGATGTKSYPWNNQRTVDLGMGWVMHLFLVIPGCPYPYWAEMSCLK